MKTKAKLSVSVQRAMKHLGESLSLTRRIKRIPMKLLAERALVSEYTVRKVLKGDPSVSMGHYASVILVLGHLSELENIGAIQGPNDPRWSHLQRDLPRRIG